MPNDVNAFFQRLLAACDEYNKPKVGKVALLEAVMLDVKPQVASVGQTVRSYFPDLGAMTDQGVSDWSPEDISPNYVDLVIDSRPGKGIKVHDFEQALSPIDIVNQYLTPLHYRAMEYVNGRIVNLLTPENFSAYPPFPVASPGKLGFPDVCNVWATLAQNKIPVDDPNLMSIITTPLIHAGMVQDPQFSQESVVGLLAAERARESVSLGVQLNARKLYDQQMGQAGTAQPGTVATTAGSGVIAGTNTSFKTPLTSGAWSASNPSPVFAVGDRVSIAGDPTVYTITVLTNNTTMTVSPVVPVSPGSLTGAVISEASANAAFIHKYSIGVALRPLALVNNGQVTSRIINLKGIPLRVQLSYQHQLGGWMLTADVAMGIKLMRSDFGMLVYV